MNVVTIGWLCLGLLVQPQKDAVPHRVLSNFDAKFPLAHELRWTRDIETGVYIANFYIQSMEKRAAFDAKGIWLYTSTILQDKELPEIIEEEVFNNFTNPTLLSCEYRITHHGDKLYIVKIHIEDENPSMEDEEPGQIEAAGADFAYLLTFDTEGTLLKKKEILN